MQYFSQRRLSRESRRRRSLLIEQLESRFVLANASPVATPFPVGNVPQGSSLRIEAADLVSDFGTDTDTLLQSNLLTFSTASVNGGAARPLTDVGFVYTPGTGRSGTVAINTVGASAFAGLASGASATVSIGFQISDGLASAAGVFTFTVTSSTRIANSVNLRVLGPTVPGQVLEANVAPSPSANTTLNISLSGLQDITDGLASLDLRQPVGTAFDTLFTNSLLTIAVAHAGSNSTATSKASDGSKSLAIAFDSSTATAEATGASQARSTAVADSVASTIATDQSQATASANDNSVASANAKLLSTATAIATDGSTADATATESSTASATAEGGAVGSATSIQGSIATADSKTSATATAFAHGESAAISTATNSSVADAVSTSNSTAAATADTSSDALAFGADGSTGVATSNRSSSTSAAAEGDSVASANANSNSASVAGAANSSVASASADVDSIAMSLAIDSSATDSTALRGSAAQAIGAGGAISSAIAEDSSAADAAANHELVSTGPLASAIIDITNELIVARALASDIVQQAITSIVNGRDDGNAVASFINTALPRNPLAEIRRGPSAVASAKFSSLATSVAVDGLDSGAQASNQLTSRARSGSTAETNIAVSTAASPTVGLGTNLGATAPLAPIIGAANVNIPLSIAVSEIASDNVDSIVLIGFPAGTVLSSGTSSNGGSTWTFTSAPPSNLTFRVPATAVGSFLLTITAQNGSSFLRVERPILIGTILSIAPTSANKAEGNTGTTPFTFTVTRQGNVSVASTVNYTVSAPTFVGSGIVDAADFGGAFPTGQVAFAPGETSKLVTINIVGELISESDENFVVRLSGVTTGQGIDLPPALGVIRNDDTSVAIVPVLGANAEGSAGVTTALTFRVTRLGDVARPSTVNYAVVGTGTNPVTASDFVGGVLPSGQVAFAANENSKLVTINVSGDQLLELDETFNVVLSNSTSGVQITTASAAGLIRNDETAFSIVATSATKAEGNSGNTPFTYTVSRTGLTTGFTTVDFAVAGSGASPVSEADFGGALPASLLRFAPNETSKLVTINANGDLTLEADEAFLVGLSNAPVGTSISVPTAAGLILNDDTSLAIAATSANKAEGNSGSTPFTFTVTRSGNLASATTVNFAVTGSGATPAQASDFAGGVFPTGQVSFAANETSKVITINVLGNTVAEANEGFTVTLSGASGGATISTATATGLIRNDDTALAIAATSANKAEGNSGSTPFTFTVTRSGNTSGATTANFAVTGRGATSAQASDFVGGVFPSGQVSFAANETSKAITVNVLGDAVIEAHEGFTVTLSNPSTGATILTATASGVIQNDENSVSIAATSATKAEGNSGTTPFTFTVTRSGNIGTRSTVNYAVAGLGTAAAQASDFVGSVFPTGQVAFAANETSKVITIPVRGDTTIEASEGFTVILSNATAGFSITTGTAAGLIQTDDISLAIAATSAIKAEGNSGSTAFTFTVTRTGLLTRATSVNYVVAGSGATPATATDFVGNVLPSGVVTFAIGETSKLITINVVGDRVVEANEGFVVNLSSATASATITTASAAGLIRNDDTSVSIVATNADQFEPVAGSTPFTFTVTRTGLTTGTSSVNFAVVGSGTNPASASDFVGGQFPSGTVVFAPGETSKLITIQVASDNIAEVNEGFTANLSSPSAGVTLGSASASGVIREGCLSGGPLVAGDNVLTYTCGVPGTIVGFALGSNSGSTTLAEHGVTLDIAGASVIGLGVVDATGRARIVVRLTAAQAAARLYFQAFEISPAGKKSNVFVD